jgi:ADP-ribose pyrophosphatase YjhB (NUDIX family)
MKKIYFDNKRLVISEDNRNNNPAPEEIKKYIDKIKSSDSPDEIILNCLNEEETLITLFSFFKEVPAAGGVVKNNKDEILFIYRKGKWDLPKGKIEEGETAKKAAIREVKEECGLTNLEIEKVLPSTYHTYSEDDATILKETYWYLMKTSELELKPQTEEGITKAEWKKEENKGAIFFNTFESIKNVINEVWK